MSPNSIALRKHFPQIWKLLATHFQLCWLHALIKSVTGFTSSQSKTLYSYFGLTFIQQKEIWRQKCNFSKIKRCLQIDVLIPEHLLFLSSARTKELESYKLSGSIQNTSRIMDIRNRKLVLNHWLYCHELCLMSSTLFTVSSLKVNPSEAPIDIFWAETLFLYVLKIFNITESISTINISLWEWNLETF